MAKKTPLTWSNQTRKLSELIPWPDNPRFIANEQAQRLDDSFRKFGQVDPLAISPENELYNGHQRLKVLVDNHGPDYEIDVRVSSRPLTEAERKQLTVYLHRGATGEWDFAKLATWDLGDLVEWGFDTDELNFDPPPAPIGTSDAEPQIDRATELREKWGTERGQLWAIGDHRLLCGDSTIRADVERVMGGEVPSLVIADPPYGVNIVAANGYVGGGESANGMIPFGGVKNRKRGYVGGGEGYRLRHGHYAIEEHKKSKGLGSVGGAKPFGSKVVRGSDGAANVVDVGKYAPIIGDETTETAKLSSSLLLEMYPKAVHSWWGANYYTDALAPSPCWLVWNKETTGNFADCELAWTNQDKAAKLFTHRWNGMLRDSERERRWHPTQKPAALALWVINEFAVSGVLLDPFAGAGWSMIAAGNAGIPSRGIELSAEYCAVILQRMADAFPHLEIHQLP